MLLASPSPLVYFAWCKTSAPRASILVTSAMDLDPWLWIIINNYSPKSRWRWIVEAANRLGKYPPLFTSTYSPPLIQRWTSQVSIKGCPNSGKRFFIVKCSVSPSCRQIKLLQGLVKLMVELNSSCCWNQAQKHQMFHGFHCDFTARKFS